MSDKQAVQIFNIILEPQTEFATLSEVKSIANQLQRTLNSVVRNLTNEPDAVVTTEITGAEIGSLHLAMRPSIADSLLADPDSVCDTLIRDINEVWHQRFRSGMTPGLLQQYRTLVNTLRASNMRIKFEHGSEYVTIDDTFRKRFQSATKERVAGSVEIVGRIEAINIHSTPYEIKLFPTQPGTEPIPCHFEEAFLSPITDEFKRKSLVRITGKGYYAPVGLYPIRMTLARAPQALSFNPEKLRSFIRNVNLVPHGMSASDYLRENQRAVGLEDD